MLLKDDNGNHTTLVTSPQIGNGDGTTPALKKNLHPPTNYSKKLVAHFSMAPTSSSLSPLLTAATGPQTNALTPTATQRLSLRTSITTDSNKTPPVFRPKKVLTVTSPAQKTIPIQKRSSAHAISPKSPPLQHKHAADNSKATMHRMSMPIADVSIGGIKSDENSQQNIYAKGKFPTVNGIHDCSECICDRSPAMVVCQRCGNELYGRVQRICTMHPKRICLMDQRECVNSFCRSVHLSEIQATQRNNCFKSSSDAAK